MDDAVNHLRQSGREINDEHLARLSPLQLDHVLLLGTFPFTLPHELAGGRRRALRAD
jgi:Tn3 transposase DDE domain-containing protein